MREDDDDIQDYVSSGWRKRQIETETMKRINEKILEVNNSNRNDVLEEVAKEIEKMKAFEKDTMASFAAFVRGMKR
jgi:fructose/tagatose bisphosphate aldolase